MEHIEQSRELIKLSQSDFANMIHSQENFSDDSNLFPYEATEDDIKALNDLNSFVDQNNTKGE